MISPLAFVHPDAKLGEGVVVEPFSYIAGDVVVGDGCHIGPGAVLQDGARMGKNCRIHTGAVIAGIPQDLKFKGEYTTVEMGDNNIVREGATINRGTAARGKTVIGSNNLFMSCSHVGHDCVVGSNCIIANCTLLAGEVELGDWAILSGHVAVHQFTRIGAHAMVSGGSLVSKDVPPYVKAAHTPLAFVGANSVGLRRRGFTTDQTDRIHEMFKILFQSGYGYGKACDMIMEEFQESEERDLIIEFIRTSKRGIIKPYSSSRNNEDTE